MQAESLGPEEAHREKVHREPKVRSPPDPVLPEEYIREDRAGSKEWEIECAGGQTKGRAS